MVAFGEGELGFISAGRRRFQLTWDDLLWSARMVYGESGVSAAELQASAVLWCMTSRMAVGRWPTFTALIQAYSQPINPRWARGGEFCGVGGRYHGNDRYCSETRLQRRESISNKTWDEIPEHIQNIVYRWATAQTANPIPRAVDFAVPGVASRSRGAEGLRARGFELVWDDQGRDETSVARGGNAFYSSNFSRTWLPRFIRITLGRSEASDSTIEEVSDEAVPLAEQRSTTSGGTSSLEVRVPENDDFEAISGITSDRTSPPEDSYGYLQAHSEVEDPQAQTMLSEEDSETLLKVNAVRFNNQIKNLKRASSLEMTKMVPVIAIFTESDDGNGIFNLSEQIFSQGSFHGYDDDFEVFPDRPLASIEGFEVMIQQASAGGLTGINTATLTLKVHNPEMVTKSHPKGKYIAYMLAQGFVMRIRYGLEGASDLSESLRSAFQWKEEDFFVQQYSVSINDDKTMTLRVSLMPATQRLLNQLRVGESLPIDEVGKISQEDLDNAISAVTSSDPEATQEEVDELRSRLSVFANQFISSAQSPGVRLEEDENNPGTFRSVLQAALTNAGVFNRPEGLPNVALPNFIEAISTIQGTLLTRRYRLLLKRDCYRYTHNSVSRNVVNVGPMIFNIAKPEIDFAFAQVSRNAIEIGEKFSVDSNSEIGGEGGRSEVHLIFGNFNSRAGNWANKPISSFPVNVNSIFGELRKNRLVGDFSSTVNSFINLIKRQVAELENYQVESTSEGSDTPTRSIEIPDMKYVIYPHPSDETAWIMYVYDNKVPTANFRNAIQTLTDISGETSQPPTREDVIELLKTHEIPWLEMGEEGSFIKSFGAETASDDMLASHNLTMLNRRAFSTRDQDASVVIPAGVSREFLANSQGVPQRVIRSNHYVDPVRVTLQSLILPTSYIFGPVFIFFPVRIFSGIYFPTEVRHEVNQNGAHTNLSLQINLSVFNHVPL